MTYFVTYYITLIVGRHDENLKVRYGGRSLLQKNIYLTFANTDNKNIVRTSDSRTTRQKNCTYGNPLKHTNIKITMNIIKQAGNR